MCRLPVALVLLLAGTALPGAGRDLKALYLERCAACHGPDGTGRGPGGIHLGGRSLIDPRGRSAATLEERVAIVLRGKGAMPGFRRQLDAEEARHLVADVIPALGVRRRRPGGGVAPSNGLP